MGAVVGEVMIKDGDGVVFDGLYRAVLAFVAGWRQAPLDRFRRDLAGWSGERRAREARTLPAAAHLAAASVGTAEGAAGEARDLLAAFVSARGALHWERTYGEADRAVSRALIEGYAFTELIGPKGPLVSDRARSGVGVWGPDVDYPRHRHGAEEIYAVLSGAGEFRMGAAAPVWRRPGEIVHTPPNLPHGFRTGAEPLILFYVWRAGDLREKSTFV